MLQDIVTGRLDATVNDRLTVGYNVKNLGLPVKPVGAPIAPVPSHFVVRKGPQGQALVKRLNEAIAALKQDGTLAKLSVKWFGADYNALAEEPGRRRQAAARLRVHGVGRPRAAAGAPVTLNVTVVSISLALPLAPPRPWSGSTASRSSGRRRRSTSRSPGGRRCWCRSTSPITASRRC